MHHNSELPTSGYVSAAWVKARYSISNSTLYAWLAGENNSFPKPVRIGPRSIRFSAEALRDYEESFKATVTTTTGR